MSDNENEEEAIVFDEDEILVRYIPETTEDGEWTGQYSSTMVVFDGGTLQPTHKANWVNRVKTSIHANIMMQNNPDLLYIAHMYATKGLEMEGMEDIIPPHTHEAVTGREGNVLSVDFAKRVGEAAKLRDQEPEEED